MKKDALIQIKGIQLFEDDHDTTELFTQGSFYKKNNHYYISYDETETTGYEGSKTILKVEGNEVVTLMRSGATKSHLIIQNGTRNIGHYGTLEGEIVIGVYAKQIESNLNDDGGDLYFSYALDINSSLVSENEVFINVKPNKQ